MKPRRVVVVGAGIAGLSAAQRLRELAGENLAITVLEQSGRLGGKLHSGHIAGLPIELGAETFLARRPEALDLATAVGLGEELVHPAGVPAALVVDSQLRDVPRRTVMGVPADAEAVSQILSPQGLRRLRAEPATPGPVLDERDITVGALVRQRFGDEITQRLVDPLLGGVYSGRADDLSLDVTIPQLAAAARTHDTLAAAVQACLPVAAPNPAPVFGSIAGGLSRLVDATAAAAVADIRLGVAVRQLQRTTTGWRLVTGETRTAQTLECDAVVLAVPARPAARLLADVDAAAAAELAVLDYASIGLVTMAIPNAGLPQRSGLLIPATEGYLSKAATFFTRKWPHRDDAELSVVRVSVGRYGQEQVLHRDDDELALVAHTELSQILGGRLPKPAEVVVQRWGGGLPQYAPGHLDRVRRARAALSPHPLAIAGAVADGVGIPACIASGHAAAQAIAGMQTIA